MENYHVSSDGVARPCAAQRPEACRAERAPGLEGHYGSKEEAQAAYEAANSADSFRTFQRPSGPTPALSPAEKMRAARAAELNDPSLKAARDARQRAREEEEQRRYREQYAVDATLSWGEIGPDQRSISVYRAGTPRALAAQDRGVEAESYALADQVKPDGRTGRLDGFCAAPSLGGVSRWVRANADLGQRGPEDYAPHRMKVDLDSTYVYNIRAWEVASSKEQSMRAWGSEPLTEKNSPYRDYWNTGISLREFVAKSQEDPDGFNPTKWEILVAPEELQSKPQPVSYERVAEATYTSYDSDRSRITDIGKSARREARILREAARREQKD